MSENGEDNNRHGSAIRTIIENGMIASVLSMAHELGILDLLATTQVPLTSRQIATQRHLKERYVREALSSLACCDVIKVKKLTSGELVYDMTSGQAEALQGDDAAFLATLGTLIARYPAVKECFKEDGPCGHSTTGDSQTPSAALMARRVDTTLSVVLEAVPGLRGSLDSGISVVEFGSGGGQLIAAFARLFTRSTFLASEYTTSGTAHLTSFLEGEGLHNAATRQLDILHLPDDVITSCDLALVSLVIHDLPDPLGGLRSCHKILRPGGFLACIEANCHSNDVTSLTTLSSDVTDIPTHSSDVTDLPTHSSDVIDHLPTLSRKTTAALYASSTFNCVAQAYQDSDSVVLGVCSGRHRFSQLIRQAQFSLVGLHPHGDDNMFVLYVCQRM